MKNPVIFPANSTPEAEQLVGLLESFIQGQIELKFAYFLSTAQTERQDLAEKHLSTLREALVKQLSRKDSDEPN